MHLIHIHIYLDLPFKSTYNIYTCNLRKGFNPILCLFGILLQTLQVEVAGKVDIHDWNFRDVKFLDIRITREIGWQLGFGFVNRITYPLLCFSNLQPGIELDHDHRVVLNRIAGDGLDISEGFGFLLNRACDQVLNVFRRGSGIGCGDDDRWDHDLRKLLFGNAEVR